MLAAGYVEAELDKYRRRLATLARRYSRGERSRLIRQAQRDADALTLLMAQAPLEVRMSVDALIDAFEEFRISCMS
jgi:hypothetical protein